LSFDSVEDDDTPEARLESFIRAGKRRLGLSGFIENPRGRPRSESLGVSSTKSEEWYSGNTAAKAARIKRHSQWKLAYPEEKPFDSFR